MSATLSFEARVVACDECGAPLVLGPASGAEACTFCGARQLAQNRSRAVPRLPVMDERQRLARLAAQDARPIEAPKLVAELTPGGQLRSWKVGEALARWKAARAALRAGHDPDAAERLHWLTKALADHFADVGEPLRERALLESALDVLELPRQRQALLSALARSACRAGDFGAAEAWLSLCDPRSDDLEADSAFRFGRAYLDAATGRHEAVLSTLGRTPAEVPISSEHEAPCVALRVDAWERLGQLETAIELYDHFNRHASGVGRYLAARFIERSAQLSLCKQSAYRAEALQRERGKLVAGKAAGMPLGAFGFAFLFSVVALGSLALGLFSLSAALTVGFFSGLLAVVFHLLAYSELRNFLRARRIRARGAPALAQIQHIRPGHQVTMGVPELRYSVLVLPASGYPFEAVSAFHATDELRARLPIGGITLVRFDTENRNAVQIELD